MMKKIPIWKNVILIVSTIVMILLATYAWFVTSPWAELNGFDVNVKGSSFIQISNDGENWADDLEVEIGLNDHIKEVSGNGVKLYAPVYDYVETADGGMSPIIAKFVDATGSQKYYEQIVSFRSDGNHDLYLAPGSYVSAVSGDEESYINGAVRVAFFELDANGKETLKYIWAPNATVEYSPQTGSFTKDGTVEANYYYQTSSTPVDVSTLPEGVQNPNVAIIPTADSNNPGEILTCGYNGAYKFMWSSADELPADAPSLMTLSLSEGETMVSKRLKIKVWLEGHDRECVSQLAGQSFTMKFEFSATKGE